MSVLFIEIFALSWEVVLRFFSKFLIDSMGNSYCKKNYSKGAVNAFKITQLRLCNEEIRSYGKLSLSGL